MTYSTLALPVLAGGRWPRLSMYVALSLVILTFTHPLNPNSLREKLWLNVQDKT